MSVKIENGKNSLDRKITVTYSLDQWSKAYGDKIKELSKTVKLPGFRPGHIPAKAIKRQFGSGVLQEVMEQEVPKILYAELDAKKINPAHFEQVDMKEIAANQDMTKDIMVEFNIEIFPEIKVPTLDEQELEIPVSKIEDKDLAATLKRMQDMHTEWSSVDRAAKKADKTVIDFDGEMDGKAFEGGSSKAMDVEIGSKSLIPGFEDGLIGLKKGDKKDLPLAFPKDYGKTELAGKPVVFKVKVVEVKEAKKPALDDEFAKKFDIKDLETLKKDVKENLNVQLNNKLEEVKKKLIGDLLVKNMPIDVPNYLVEQEVVSVKSQMYSRFNLPKEKLEELVSQMPTTPENLSQAQHRVRLGLIFNHMVQEEKIKPTQDQLDKQISKMTQLYADSNAAKQQILQDKEAVSHAMQIAIEDELVDRIFKKLKVSDKQVDFDKLLAEY